ncbi:MAG: NADH:ubiquinone reductase (Na(+)-transporting) subunit C [Spirochaetes bacterium]|nr:NADH:ubiquinone reductase (Na(+)-transporting) subunit C [Spirochaetota bacterium]
MRQTNTYTFVFIVITALIAALVLSAVSQSLKDRQALNIENDRKKNILIALGVYSNNNCKSDSGELCDVQCCYDNYIKSYAVDFNGKIAKGDFVPERIIIEKELEKPETERIFPVFTRVSGNKIEAYCIPVAGKGVWSTLYGYIALENDLNTVAGLTFYQHAETPGLGAEIEKDWFQNSFAGKKILNEKKELVSVKVVKGKVRPDSENKIHEVDGISGATLTGNGVTKLLKSSLALYEPYFRTARKEIK